MTGSPGAWSKRRSYAVVGGLAALTAVTALLGIAWTVITLAFAWGYVAVGLLLGGISLLGFAGVLLIRRHQRN